MKVGAISFEDIERFVGEKLSEVKRSTVRQHINVLRMVLSAGVRWKKLRANVAKEKQNYGTWEDKDQEIDPLAREEVRTFLDHAGEWHTFFMVAFCTGMRVGEMLAMKWINLEGDNYSVTENLRRDRTFGAPKTRSSKAPVKLSPDVVAALRTQRKRVAEQRLQAKTWEDLDLIFPMDTGKPYGDHSIRLRFHEMLKALNIPRRRLHDIRHTCAALMMKRGETVLAVQRQMRHASAKMTLDVYGHLYPEDHVEALARFDEQIRVTNI